MFFCAITKNSNSEILTKNLVTFNPVQEGLFRGSSRMEGEPKRPPLPKICQTNPTMMRLGRVVPYLKMIQKLYELRDTPREFC